MSLLDTNFKDFFSKLLPIYIIREDSYKDSEDRGLFERYMMLFGDNIDEQISSEVENYLNIIDATICDEKFLNHISDVLGNPPDVFLNEAQYRNLLSYILSVYKIKGTKRAYELFFSMLGFVIEIEEIPPISNEGNYDSEGNYDGDELLAIYDQNLCQPCSFYTIKFYYRDDLNQVVTLQTLELLRAAIDFNEPINARLKSFDLVINLSDEMSIGIQDTDLEVETESVYAYDAEHEYDEELEPEGPEPIEGLIILSNNESIGASTKEEFDDYFNTFATVLYSNYNEVTNVYTFTYPEKTSVGVNFLRGSDGNFLDPEKLIIQYGNNSFAKSNINTQLSDCVFGNDCFNFSDGVNKINNSTFGVQCFFGAMGNNDLLNCTLGNNSFTNSTGDNELVDCELTNTCFLTSEGNNKISNSIFGSNAFQEASGNNIILDCEFGYMPFGGATGELTINNILSGTWFAHDANMVINILNSIGPTVGNDLIFQEGLSGVIINAPIILETINEGDIEGDLQHAIDNGATVNFV